MPLTRITIEGPHQKKVQVCLPTTAEFDEMDLAQAVAFMANEKGADFDEDAVVDLNRGEVAEKLQALGIPAVERDG